MVRANYIFDSTKHLSEKIRLRALETVHDSSTQRRLLTTGLKAGCRCLEVGPGTGSIMRWLANRVGTHGQVTALDLNPRFISHTRLPNVEVRQADICHVALQAKSFDLIHCRHVLIHSSDPQAAIRNMMKSLKSGGWIVLEEPDFFASRAISGTSASCQAVRRVNRAILTLFSNKGSDPGLGSRLPSLTQQYGLTHFVVENDVPISRGRSSVANVMSLSAQQLQDQYLSTGLVTSRDIRYYRQFANNARSWAIYYGTVAVSGKKTVNSFCRILDLCDTHSLGDV